MGEAPSVWPKQVDPDLNILIKPLATPNLSS